jgi:signal transduction histidine kinase
MTRAKSFFTTKGAGTGLGLAIVRKIIDAHRGKIGVQSAPNEGTTFVVRLPMAT